MRIGITISALLLSFSTFAPAADFVGYVIDASCATKAAMKGNEACARKCIKGGSPAVLLGDGDKVYKRKTKTKGVLSFQAPIKPPTPRL